MGTSLPLLVHCIDRLLNASKHVGRTCFQWWCTQWRLSINPPRSFLHIAYRLTIVLLRPTGVLYGMTAEKVHGPQGSMPMHCLKFFLYNFICACGLVSGPTRRAIRDEYKLPIAPQFLESQGENADCLTGTIPCVACFALCQDVSLSAVLPTPSLSLFFPHKISWLSFVFWMPCVDNTAHAPIELT